MALTSQRTSKATLYTLPQSHYCEIARWSLSSAGVDFEEATFLPGIHRFLSPIGRIRREGRAVSGSEFATPLLVGADGREILAGDSFQCLHFASGGAEVVDPRIHELLDTIVGPSTRSIAWHYALDGEAGDRLMDSFTSSDRIPLWQRLLFRFPPVRKYIRDLAYRRLVKSPEYVQKCRDRLLEAFAEIQGHLGREPFTGERLTGASIALAALVAPVVNPPNYAISFYGRQADIAAGYPALQEEVAFWRKTAVGAWALDFYAKHRVA